MTDLSEKKTLVTGAFDTIKIALNYYSVGFEIYGRC